MVVVLVAVAAVAVAAVVILTTQSGQMSETLDTYNQLKQVATSPSPSPISDSTDVDTLEDELDATVVGEFETDIDAMESEASGL